MFIGRQKFLNLLILDSTESSEHDTLEFELKIKCSLNKDSRKDSSRADDIYKNNNGEC